jgi:predicted  nucleic acid-binding Zn-ribbon protein
MKILSDDKWFEIQTDLSELKIEVMTLRDKKAELEKEIERLKGKSFNLKQEADSLRHSLEMANELIKKSGVTSGKTDKPKSNKKKEK